MQVRAERAGPAVVVHVEGGRLVVEEDTRALHDLVRALTRLDHACSVVLDLGKVWQLDCSGIGQLVDLANQVAAGGGLLSLLNVAPRLKHLLALLGLLQVLPAFASRDEAITACWSARARECAPRRPRGAMPAPAVWLSGEGSPQMAPAL